MFVVLCRVWAHIAVDVMQVEVSAILFLGLSDSFFMEHNSEAMVLASKSQGASNAVRSSYIMLLCELVADIICIVVELRILKVMLCCDAMVVAMTGLLLQLPVDVVWREFGPQDILARVLWTVFVAMLVRY